MGNPEHIRWLREGVEAWNAGRNREYFRPDLQSEDFQKMLGSPAQEGESSTVINLRDIDLSDANLREATFARLILTWANYPSIDLSHAQFPGADLTRCSFLGTNLTDANFSGANLKDAQFWKADLTHADFSEANLTGARFRECILEDTQLYKKVRMTGADFMLSRPWNAILFHPLVQAGVSSDPLIKERLGTVSALLEACREFRRRAQGLDLVLYFRGQPCSWPLSPSVTRESALRLVEGEMLNDLTTRQPEAFNGLGLALAQWVLAQHHGLKTRLLDVTRNPLVALFYACYEEEYLDKDGRLHIFGVPRSLIKPFNSDAVSIITNFAKLSRGEQNLLLGKAEEDAIDDAFPANIRNFVEGPGLFAEAMHHLYYAIRQEKPSFEERIDIRDLYRVFVVEPQRMFERVRSQSGAFLISAFHERFEQNEVLRWNADTPIYSHFELDVPEEQKHRMLEELRLLNVTRETLLPSIDESASAITQHYRDSVNQTQETA